MAQPKRTAVSPVPAATAAESTTEQPKRRGRKPGQKVGPTLTWNDARDRALMASLYDGERRRTNAEVAEILKGDPAFEGSSDAVTPFKVGLRLGNIRSAGVPVPRAARSRYKPDTAALASFLPPSVLKSSENEGSDSDQG